MELEVFLKSCFCQKHFGKPGILYLLNLFDKFNNAGALMQDSLCSSNIHAHHGKPCLIYKEIV